MITINYVFVQGLSAWNFAVQAHAANKGGCVMGKCDPPVVDLGNYPVIFASVVARIDKLSHGMVSIAMAEERRNDEGRIEWVIVCRLIRPLASMDITAQLVAQLIGDMGSRERALFVAQDSPAGVQ